MAEKKNSSVAVWSATIILAVLFMWAGWSILNGSAANPYRQCFADWFYNSIGALVFGAGLLLLFPKTAWIAAATLGVIMAGAVATILLYTSFKFNAVIPAMLVISLSSLAYYRFPRKVPPV